MMVKLVIVNAYCFDICNKNDCEWDYGANDYTTLSTTSTIVH